MNSKRILIFLAIALGVPWAAALGLSLTVGVNDPLAAVTWANYIFISTPALANIAARLITGEGRRRLMLRPNFRRGRRAYLAAWLLPLAATAVGASIYFLLFSQAFDANLGALQALMAGSPLNSAGPWTLFAIIVIQSMITGLVINGLASIGEEFGWRAYLLPKLIDHFSGSRDEAAPAADPAAPGSFTPAAARKASLVVGLIWGVWHWPLLLMSMRIDPSQPLVFLPVYLIFTCSLSMFLSWVTLRSGSVWPASIGHGVINATAALPALMVQGAPNLLLGPQPTGLIGGLGYLALAVVLMYRFRGVGGEVESTSDAEWQGNVT